MPNGIVCLLPSLRESRVATVRTVENLVKQEARGMSEAIHAVSPFTSIKTAPAKTSNKNKRFNISGGICTT